MPWAALQPLSALTLASLFGLVVAAASGCGTDAVGIEDCRQIEQARCEAGAACGLVKDVDACKRFFRDHCLHGMALESSPGTPQVKACVAAITSAAQCARALGAQIAIPDCPDPSGIGVTTLTSACEVVSKPEQTEPCRFLVPATPPPTFDAAVDTNVEDSGAD